MENGKLKNLIRCAVFLLLLALTIAGVQGVLRNGDNRSFQAQRGFAAEKEGVLDGVFIGASNVHAFFEPPFIWDEYGFACYSYSVDSMDSWAIKYMITEARKTQPDALFIVVLNSFKTTEPTVQSIHRSVDYLPWSANKVRLIGTLSREAGITGLDQLEFYFPIIRFHSRWSELEEWDFSHQVNGMKGSLVYWPYLKNTQDVSKSYNLTTDLEALEEKQAECLEDLLDYCDAEQVRVLFVTVPQAISDQTVLMQYNTIEDRVRERGYDCLDLMDPELCGIQPDTDYYNKNHTNVHGSLKISDYLADYLNENYGFSDKRGAPGYESWDEAVALYGDVIGPYTLSFERSHAPRNYDLTAPKLSKLKVDGQTITVSWGETEGAEGYDVYRKAADEYDGYWVYVATVEDGLSLTDYGLFPGTSYTYTVVPYDRAEDGAERYGCFSYAGVSAATEEE